MEKVVVRPYVKNFIMNRSLHDLKRPSFHCRCGDSNPTREIVYLNVINEPRGVIAKFNIIAKICNYKRLHEGHHFIPMTMEVHNTLGRDMDRFIRECACLLHNKCSRDHLFMSFHNQFFKQRVSIVLQHVLTFAIEKKITLACDACFRLPIIIKSHNLHARDIRGAMGEIASYHKRDWPSPSLFGPFRLCISWPFFGLLLLYPLGWFWPSFFIYI
jgi:hypothetical protein